MCSSAAPAPADKTVGQQHTKQSISLSKRQQKRLDSLRVKAEKTASQLTLPLLFLDFCEAQSIARDMEFETAESFFLWHLSGKAPKEMPLFPDIAYRRAGWSDWESFLRQEEDSKEVYRSEGKHYVVVLYQRYKGSKRVEIKDYEVPAPWARRMCDFFAERKGYRGLWSVFDDGKLIYELDRHPASAGFVKAEHAVSTISTAQRRANSTALNI